MSKSKTDMSSKAVMLNFAANIFQFILRLLLGLWFTRFLIHNLGAALYGLVPLAYGISRYFSLFTLILNAPSGRFLIIARSQKNFEEENEIFNTVFWGVCYLCIALVLVCSIVSFVLPFFLNIPEGHTLDARILFLAASFAFIATTFKNPFSLSTYVTNKLYLRNFADACENIFRVFIPTSLILFFGWSIGAMSLGIVLSAGAGIIISFIFWRYLTPELKIEKQKINVSMLKTITTMGGWMVVTQIGSLLFLQSELFVVNILFGANETGKYGALLVFPTMLRAVGGMISGNLQPVIMDRYAKRDMDGVFRIVFGASRFIGWAMALPLGLVVFFSGSLLEVWLGKEYVVMAPVLSIMVAHLSVNLLMLPIFTLQTMANKVKIPGLVTLGLGVFNVLLAIILANPHWAFGVLGIPLAGAIVLTLKNSIFSPVYGAMILNLKKTIFFPPMVPGIAGFFICGVLSVAMKCFVQVTNIFQLLQAYAGVTIVYLLLAWVLLLSRDEKYFLKQHILKLKIFQGFHGSDSTT